MKWRRGLLLAGIHLVLAALLISRVEWHSIRQMKSEQTHAAYHLQLTAWQEDQTFRFNPCSGFVDYALGPEQRVVQWTNIPAFALVGWGVPCPAHWTIAGRMHRKEDDPILAVSLGVLIPIQWFFVGAFPLVRTRRWLGEPGAFITVCSVVASVLILVSWIDPLRPLGSIAQFPALPMPFLWLWWLALLVWRSLRPLWGRPTATVATSRQ